MREYLTALTFMIASSGFIQSALAAPIGPEARGLRFEVRYSNAITDQIRALGLQVPITGRAYVILSRDNSKEPRFQTGPTGVPIWGKNVYALEPERGAVIDSEVFGYPLKSIADIPPGEYFVQGYLNIYTEFKRSDGHTVWLHKDQWEGQKWDISPGNVASAVVKIRIDPADSGTIRLVCDRVNPAIAIPADSQWVKRIKFESKILSEFWGQPMYLGATILLPKGYESHPNVSYPVNYAQGHFSLGAPFYFRDEPPEGNNPYHKFGYDFYQYWISDDCPRMLAVTFQHPCPYYDDSYAVNSPNIGPYGDAIMEELIPMIEEKFRIIRKPFARLLSGGSTGGWISFALQLFHPDYFGGTWTGYPDPLDFRRFQLQNIYEQPNMYYTVHSWTRVDIPETRTTDGDVLFQMKDRCHHELVIGDKSRSGLVWSIWNALFSPIGEDGYPRDLWDWESGEIDAAVAEDWKRLDLSLYLRKNWDWLGPKLVGKLHLYAGDMDDAYLNLSVVLVEKFLESTTAPYYGGTVEYGDRGPHGWMPNGRDLFELFEEHLLKNTPKSEIISSRKH